MIFDLFGTKKKEQCMKYTKFAGKILIVGYGSVGQCTLPLILRHIEVPRGNITVLEADNNENYFRTEYPDIRYVVETITKNNIYIILSNYLDPGDMLIDLSVDIDAITIMDFCQRHDVLYLNTSLENWPDEFQSAEYPPEQRTLYYHHYNVRKFNKKNWNPKGPTAVVTHGANPGLVTHFAKKALLDVAKEMGVKGRKPKTKKAWAVLSQKLGVKTIHISERDTQVSFNPKIQDEFVNTWSVVGFCTGGIAPSEMGWGTHETWHPEGLKTHRIGPKNARYNASRSGTQTLVRSWLPLGGDINGYCIQHSESVTLSDYFTVWKDDAFYKKVWTDSDSPVTNNNVIYRPTVHYAYHPCNDAIVSTHELNMRDWHVQPNHRILKNDIISGIDELGVLLLGHEKNAWWYGSQLSIEETRMLIPNQNATTLQSAASILAAVIWIIKNPHKGYNEPEDLPHDEILDIASQYLGPMPSVQSDWTPLKDRNNLYDQTINEKEVWSFQNILIQ